MDYTDILLEDQLSRPELQPFLAIPEQQSAHTNTVIEAVRYFGIFHNDDSTVPSDFVNSEVQDLIADNQKFDGNTLQVLLFKPERILYTPTILETYKQVASAEQEHNIMILSVFLKSYQTE